MGKFVKAAHLFLSDREIEHIMQYVPQALKEIPHLELAENSEGLPAVFMGVGGQKPEMLFVSSGKRRKGV